MKSIGILGLSVRDHDAATLGRFTLARGERPVRLTQLASALGVTELVYLATCNRVELIWRDAPGTERGDLPMRAFQTLVGHRPDPGEAERMFRAWTGAA